MSLVPVESDFAEMVKSRMDVNYFMHEIGFEITRIEAGEVEGVLNVGQRHRQQMNFVHGGVSATLADIVAGFAAYTLVSKHQGIVTIELKVSYLNPGVGERLFAKGMVIKAGSRVHFCESELWTESDSGRVMVAKASATMAVISKEDIKR